MRHACESVPPLWFEITDLSQRYGYAVSRLPIAIGEEDGLLLVHTPLHLAASYGRTNLMALLLARGADASAEDYMGRSPLHSCVALNCAEGVRLLLAWKADLHYYVDPLSSFGVVHCAALEASVGILATLVAAGADLHAVAVVDGVNRQAVDFAADAGSAAVLEWIWLMDQEYEPWEPGEGYKLLRHIEPFRFHESHEPAIALLECLAEGNCPVCNCSLPREPFSACDSRECARMRSLRRAELVAGVS